MAIINKNQEDMKLEQEDKMVVDQSRIAFAGTYPTGYEVWDEANRYRVTQNKKELILDKRFCNNIGSRAQNYRNTNSHEGLEDFVDKYLVGINKVSEILNWGRTAKEVVDGWASSPSHNLTLLDSNRGCAYSDDGYSVMLLGY